MPLTEEVIIHGFHEHMYLSDDQPCQIKRGRSLPFFMLTPFFPFWKNKLCKSALMSKRTGAQNQIDLNWDSDPIIAALSHYGIG